MKGNLQATPTPARSDFALRMSTAQVTESISGRPRSSRMSLE
jgi:hypothetical protein